MEMDADIVREIEFSRSLRGYNTAEVGAAAKDSLKKLSGSLRSIRK